MHLINTEVSTIIGAADTRQSSHFYSTLLSQSITGRFHYLSSAASHISLALFFHPSRYRLTRIAVDNTAGPYRNYTIVFLGSERGIILKFLAKINSGFLNDSLFLEELSIYNPEKYVFH